ncbi:SprT-like domain-containing protein [Riemerella columbina]|uniref:SprT-like domain-containing protein n=1 Tax=Riemerella columbina TaxID=103810 RepID=UPI00036EF2E5|nr:SprT-like domain-containing protein [Riemerella columbina]
MSLQGLQQFLPSEALPYIERWLQGQFIHIKITRARQSKLGDYRKLPNGGHQITVNGNLEPALFFFVLTHEIAHLLAFKNYRNILPHGKEWKQTFRNLLLESLEVYKTDLQPIIKHFAKNPKASFNADPQLVKYFRTSDGTKQTIDTLAIGSRFDYRGLQYKISEKRKKRYLCIQTSTGKPYLFSPCAEVEPILS